MLKDIIGQDKAIGILLRTIQRRRIPSSYLFAGESGIGKKLAAINLAKALNCLAPLPSHLTKGGIEVGHDCCDECDSCRKIDHGVHPDFLLISPEGGQIRIEEIRATDDVLSLKAFEGKYKVLIVDDADTMNQNAANAFLKTLEEPPEDSLIILISSNPDRLPDTIRSRCSRINFTPLSQEDCEEVINKVINRQKSRVEVRQRRSEKVSKPSVPPEPLALSLMVRLSMGRPGVAIAEGLIEEREWFINLLNGMLNAEKDSWSSKEEMEKWFDYLLILLRDMTVMKITGSEACLFNIDLKDYLYKLSSSLDVKVIIENYQRLNILKGYFNFNLNKSLTWNYTGALLRKTIGVINA